MDVSKESGNSLQLCRVHRDADGGVVLACTLTVNPDFSWCLHVGGMKLASPLLATLPSGLLSISAISTVLNLADYCVICSGNADKKYVSLAVSRKGVFLDSTGLQYNLALIYNLTSMYTWLFYRCKAGRCTGASFAPISNNSLYYVQCTCPSWCWYKVPLLLGVSKNLELDTPLVAR